MGVNWIPRAEAIRPGLVKVVSTCFNPDYMTWIRRRTALRAPGPFSSYYSLAILGNLRSTRDSEPRKCGTACPFDTVAFVGAGSFGRLFGAQLLVAVMCLAAREALQVQRPRVESSSRIMRDSGSRLRGVGSEEDHVVYLLDRIHDSRGLGLDKKKYGVSKLQSVHGIVI